jgi:hypothetical protein
MSSTTQQEPLCPICKQPTTGVKDIEQLPDGTMLAIAEHGKQQYHTFGKFVLHEKKGKVEEQSGIKVKCPKCGEDGLAYTRNTWHEGMPEHERHLHRAYFVRHVNQESNAKYNHSCERQEDRENLLKQLGRYRNSPPPLNGDAIKIKKKRGPYKRRNKTQKRLDRERRLKLKEKAEIPQRPRIAQVKPKPERQESITNREEIKEYCKEILTELGKKDHCLQIARLTVRIVDVIEK